MNEKEKTKWVLLLEQMSNINILSFIITLLEINFTVEERSLIFKKESELFDFYESAINTLNKTGELNVEQLAFQIENQ
jgi:hypothetical protein